VIEFEVNIDSEEDFILDENVECNCDDECDCDEEELVEDTTICEHKNLIEKEFNKNSCQKLGVSVIISSPHTVRFLCRDCGMPIDIFVVGGAFIY
jgi:hypothetical protein